jgi:endonuclease III
MERDLGHLDPRKLAAMGAEDLHALLQRLPVRPRYVGDAVYTILDVSRIVARDFAAQAERIWIDRPVREIQQTLLSVRGIGPGIANMTINLLHRYFQVRFSLEDMRRIDVKPDVHVERVFQRTGLSAAPGLSLGAARELSADYPGDLDLGAWEIGRRWCHATYPAHADCPLGGICPQIGAGERGREGASKPVPRTDWISSALRAGQSSPTLERAMVTRGGPWSFEDFCVVYCNRGMSSTALAQRLGRTPGAIEAVWASIDAVVAGKASPTFPGAKWEDMVRRAQAGECNCGKSAG